MSSASNTWNFRYNFPNFFLKSWMYGIVGSLAMFISSWEKSDRMRDQFLDKHRNYGDTYDFIVVGGGTAGSIVANRLSEHYKVLLLEAGGEPHPFQSIPLMSNFMQGYPELDWSFKTTRQPHALFGSEENKGRISAGKGLGGTSNLDYMMFLRGSPLDYDNWANIAKDPSWGYKSIMKYFKRFEKYDGPWNQTTLSEYHGKEGEMRLAIPEYNNKNLAKRFIAAGNELGYPFVDLNSPYTQGFDMIPYPIKMGNRQTAYKSFLKRAGKDRWHLEVQKYAHVNKILTRGDSNEAYAVAYERHGAIRIAYAKKEVILSAGAINTPKILMHSGIGAADQLQSVGIPVKVHLPEVGRNLQDHLGVYLGPFYAMKKKVSLQIDRDLNVPGSLLNLNIKGPMTTTGYQAVGMLSSESSKVRGHQEWPDIQMTLYGIGLHATVAEDFSHARRLKKSVLEPYFKSRSRTKDAFFIVVTASRPKSRGEIRLKNNNPTSEPHVDPKYLSRIEDVGVLVDGIKKASRMVENTVHFRKIGARFTNRKIDGCKQYRERSDEYWSCYVRMMGVSMGDIVGTAALGSVVDKNLKVRGVSRLRVIDASIMPTIVGAGTTAATMMIAEKGSDEILNLWGARPKHENFLSEHSAITSILNATRQRLKSLDTSKLFLNSIRNSDSFKTMVQEKGQSGLLDQVKTGQMNAFHLIGAMLKNTLTQGNTTNNQNLVTFTTSSPLVDVDKVTIFHQTPGLNNYPKLRPTSTPAQTSPVTKISSSKNSQSHLQQLTTDISSLFGTGSNKVTPVSPRPLKITNVSYVLTPKPILPPVQTSPKHTQAFRSSVSNIIINYANALDPPTQQTNSPPLFHSKVKAQQFPIVVSTSFPISHHISSSSEYQGLPPSVVQTLENMDKKKNPSPSNLYHEIPIVQEMELSLENDSKDSAQPVLIPMTHSETFLVPPTPPSPDQPQSQFSSLAPVYTATSSSPPIVPQIDIIPSIEASQSHVQVKDFVSPSSPTTTTTHIARGSSDNNDGMLVNPVPPFSPNFSVFKSSDGQQSYVFQVPTQEYASSEQLTQTQRIIQQDDILSDSSTPRLPISSDPPSQNSSKPLFFNLLPEFKPFPPGTTPKSSTPSAVLDALVKAPLQILSAPLRLVSSALEPFTTRGKSAGVQGIAKGQSSSPSPAIKSIVHVEETTSSSTRAFSAANSNENSDYDMLHAATSNQHHQFSPPTANDQKSLSKNFQVIYQAATGKVGKRPTDHLADSVQDILSQPLKIPAHTPVLQDARVTKSRGMALSNPILSFINDGKIFGKEVSKLLMRNHGNRNNYPSPYDPPKVSSPKATTTHRLPFTKMIHKVLADYKKLHKVSETPKQDKQIKITKVISPYVYDRQPVRPSTSIPGMSFSIKILNKQ